MSRTAATIAAVSNNMNKLIPILLLIAATAPAQIGITGNAAFVGAAGFSVASGGGGGGSPAIWLTNSAATTSGFGVGYDNSYYYFGQQSIPGANTNVTKVTWKLSKAGTISGAFTYVCKIFTMSGTDLGTLTGTSETVSGDDAWSETLVDFTFSSPVALSSGTDYAFVIQRTDGGVSSSNYVTARVTAEGGLVGSYAHWRTTLIRENFGSLDCAIGIVAQ